MSHNPAEGGTSNLYSRLRRDDENFYGELHSLSRSISGWPKNNKINT